MCNLHSNLTSHDAMRQLFDVEPENSKLGNLPALRAIFPKYETAIVAIGQTGKRTLVRSSWGFLTPNKSKKTGAWLKPRAWNNTRDDNITSGLWAASFQSRRCLIPATAFAETTGRSPATYHWISTANAEPFAFAGIWQHRKGAIGDTQVDGVFHSMMTTTPNELTAEYHNRMPVILGKEDYEAWLKGPPDAAKALLKPCPAGWLEVIGSAQGMTEQPTG